MSKIIFKGIISFPLIDVRKSRSRGKHMTQFLHLLPSGITLDICTEPFYFAGLKLSKQNATERECIKVFLIGYRHQRYSHWSLTSAVKTERVKDEILNGPRIFASRFLIWSRAVNTMGSKDLRSLGQTSRSRNNSRSQLEGISHRDSTYLWVAFSQLSWFSVHFWAWKQQMTWVDSLNM